MPGHVETSSITKIAAAVAGILGCGFMAHAIRRPDRWTSAAVLAAAFALGAVVVVIGCPLVLFGGIGR